jgi:hypothetical protein
MHSTIYLISRTTDRADDLIALELRGRGVPFHRFNVDRFPAHITVAFDPVAGCLSLGDEDASDLLSGEARAWTRGLRIPRHACDDASRYVLDECADLLHGVFRCSPSSAWVSHPSAIENASFKASQLWVAARVGFALPNTVMTTDVNSVRRHLIANPTSVTKPVTGRRIMVDGRQASVYTASLDAADLPDGDSTAPFCAQERLVGRDVRVTVIGDRCHAVAITTRSEAPDWRLADDRDVAYEIIELPPKVEKAVLDLVNTFDLKYAAVDLFQSRESYYFLELNPGGQWAWLEYACGLRLTGMIVDELLEEES